MTSDQPIRWGIIGPGTIARTFADGVAHSRTGKLVAIATRNPAKPGLAEGFPGARIVDGYEALLSDKEIDAIYIAVPHTGHAEWAIKAARAGKHIWWKSRSRSRPMMPKRFTTRRKSRRLCRRGLHVPRASADREAGRARQKRRHRHRSDHPLELRLQYGQLQAGTPAFRQRYRWRRYSRCRRLSGLDGR